MESIPAGTPVVLANLGGLSYVLSEIGGHPIDMKGDVSGKIAKRSKPFSRTISMRISKFKGGVSSALSRGRA